MTKQQLSRVDMFRALVALCLKYPNVVKLIAAFKNVADKLGPNVAAIKAAELIEDQTAKSVTGSKNGLKEQLISIITDVAAALFALANDTKNPDLQAKVSYSASDIKAFRQEILVTVASAIYDLGLEYKSELDTYGISAAVINSIPGLVEDFSTAIPTPRIEKAARKAAGKTIKTLVGETSGLLINQLDKTALILKKDNPDFYNEYRSARKIVKPGVIHTSIRGTVLNGKMPVYKASIEIEELGLKMYTNLQGVFDSRKIKNGIYNVRVGASGCLTQIFGNVTVKMGKAVLLDVRLMSEVMEMSRVA